MHGWLSYLRMIHLVVRQIKFLNLDGEFDSSIILGKGASNTEMG